MMKKLAFVLFLTAICIMLPGCWSKKELTELGFVMGIAIDQGKDGKIDMLTQIYRPTSVQSTASALARVSSINIKTSDDSLMEAVRDVTIHLGRKAQFSHMRIIVVGEKLARSDDVGKLLDLFYRDHEPRSSVSLAIAKGKASKMFEKRALIEQTSAQQLLRAEETAYSSSGKTMDTSLLSFVMQMKSAHPDIIVSYVYEDKISDKMYSSAGLVLLKNGKMKTVLPSNKVEGLLMLRNEYKSGVIEIPCADKKREVENTEILAIHSRTKPVIKGDKVSVSVKLQGDISIGELKCTKMATEKDEAEFIHRIEAKMKEQMKSTIRFLQANQIEVIGIGNAIYKMEPKKWEKMKRTWDAQFAEVPIDIQVKLRLVTNGTITGKPAVETN